MVGDNPKVPPENWYDLHVEKYGKADADAWMAEQHARLVRSEDWLLAEKVQELHQVYSDAWTEERLASLADDRERLADETKRR